MTNSLMYYAMYQRIDKRRRKPSEQLDRYVIEQNNALQAIAQKILLGNVPNVFLC